MTSPNIVEHPIYKARLLGLESIEASAGTGKTWTITGLVVRALLRGKRIDEILVITFTKPAAAELRVRIAARIFSCAQMLAGKREGGDEFEAALPTWLEQEGILASVALNLLTLAQANIDTMSVQTIHSFSQQTLQAFGLSAGLAGEYELVADAQTILEQQTERYLSDCNNSANAEQFSLRLVAGLIKTKELAARFTKALVRLDRPSLPAGIDWTAWFDAQDRAAKQFQAAWQVFKQAIEARGGMFAEVMGYLFNHHGAQKQYYAAWFVKLDRVASAGDSQACLDIEALGKGFERLQRIAKHGNRSQARKTDVPLLPLGLEAAEHELSLLLATLEELAEAGERESNFEGMMALDFRLNYGDRVVSAKREARLQTFDDLIDQMAYVIAKDPSFAKQCAMRFPLVLVDESQDNNAQLWEIFLGMHKAMPDTHGLVVVGDPKQAIYRFRGADLDAYFEVTRQAIQTYQLLDNQRSTEGVIEATNALFARPEPFRTRELRYQASKRGSKPALTLMEHQQLCTKGIEFLSIEFSDELGDELGDELSAPRRDARVAQVVASEIAELIASKSTVLRIQGSEQTHSLKHSDIAVLVSNNKQAALVKNALLSLGLGSSIRQRDSVFKELEADWLCWLCTGIADPMSQTACTLVAGLPLFGASHAQLMGHELGHASPWLAQLQEALQKANTTWRAQGFMPAIETLRYRYAWDQKLGSEQAQPLARQTAAKRHIANLNLLLDLAASQQPALDSPEAMIAWLAQSKLRPTESSQPYLSESGDLVQIATIHASKGLEYPVVYLPYACRVKPRPQSSPGEFLVKNGVMRFDESPEERQRRKEGESIAAQEEQLRLLYVAVTRAQSLCVIPIYPNESLAKSSLAYLLQGTAQQPLSFKELRAACEALPSSRLRVLSDVVKNEASAQGVPSGQIMKAPQLWCRTETRHWVRADWGQTSFSWVANHSHRHSATGDDDTIADHDGVELPTSPIDTVLVLENLAIEHRLPSSADMGKALHAVMELANWQTNITADEIRQQFDRFGIVQTEPFALIARWLDRVREAHLSELTHSLREISFEFSLDTRSIDALSSRLVAAGILPKAVQLSMLAKGFLRGVIDAVVLVDGKFYVMDWKSNKLGEDVFAYDKKGLNESMHASLYRLQAWLYLLALDKFLAQRVPNYQASQHLGGAMYVYLRGVQNEETKGVYAEAFDEVLLSMFKECFL